MIHNVRLPEETKTYLWGITRLQIEILCAAAKLSEVAQEDLLSNLCSELGRYISQERAKNITKWLSKQQKTLEKLQIFVQGPQKEKKKLVCNITRDAMSLYNCERNKSLNCLFGGEAPNYQKAARDFLISFYDKLESGIESSLLDENPNQYQKYGREQFFDAYERENPMQYVCAICDEHRPITILRGRRYSEIEHYFPKSIYPHLACHPYNLIPICGACNAAHYNRDPLSRGNGGRRKLGEIFLPYRSESLSLQGLVKFEWTNQLKPKISIEPLPSSDSFEEKLKAFLEIYDVQKRWQERIHQIGEQLWRYMKYYLLAETKQGEKLDVFTVKNALERLLRYFIEDLGANSWNYVLMWYLSHLLVAGIEQAIQKNHSTNALLQSLEDMLTHQRPAPSPRLRAEEVLETSRRLYSP